MSQCIQLEAPATKFTRLDGPINAVYSYECHISRFVTVGQAFEGGKPVLTQRHKDAKVKKSRQISSKAARAIHLAQAAPG